MLQYIRNRRPPIVVHLSGRSNARKEHAMLEQMITNVFAGGNFLPFCILAPMAAAMIAVALACAAHDVFTRFFKHNR